MKITRVTTGEHTEGLLFAAESPQGTTHAIELPLLDERRLEMVFRAFAQHPAFADDKLIQHPDFAKDLAGTARTAFHTGEEVLEAFQGPPLATK